MRKYPFSGLLPPQDVSRCAAGQLRCAEAAKLRPNDDNRKASIANLIASAGDCAEDTSPDLTTPRPPPKPFVLAGIHIPELTSKVLMHCPAVSVVATPNFVTQV